jgi:uncharacterized repeat protein (TIGR01451 family)
MKTTAASSGRSSRNFGTAEVPLRGGRTRAGLHCAAVVGLLALSLMLSTCGGADLSIHKGFEVIADSVSPSTIAAGGATFTAVIDGSGFASAIVEVNGQAVPTIPVSTTQVNAQISSNLTANPGTLTLVVVDLLPSGNVTSNPVTITVTGGGAQPPDLTITKTHSGNFTQGQTGATYTITVRNVGTGSTSGTVTVSDTVPTGETSPTATGTGWVCNTVSVTVTCTRSDILDADSNYSAITLTVNVAANAPSSATNTGTVSGGGDTTPGNNSSSDVTTIVAPLTPDLAIAKTHSGNFTQGQTGATYTINVSNVGTGPTSGTVTVTDTLPAGLTGPSATGTGWVCNTVSVTVTCTRGDALAAGSAYLPITLTVNVAANASSSVTNTGTVSGGGDTTPGNNTSSDVTTIAVSVLPVGVFLQVSSGDGDSNLPYASFGDPFVSFSSTATNLVANDTNGQLDVFEACVVGGATTSCAAPIARESLTSSNAEIPGGAGPVPPNGTLQASPMSGDGRFVVFVSSDPNVISPATDGALNIYVRDTCVGASSCAPTTFVASTGPTGAADQNSVSPSISSNGRVVAFMSVSFILAPPASGFQIYARDTCFGAPAGCIPSTVLVSADNSGNQGNGFSDHPSVSGDGRFVAFESSSNNLVPTSSNSNTQIFLRDTCIGAPAGCVPSTTLTSGNSTGASSDSFSQNPSTSGDGRFVVFASQSSDILPGNTAGGRPDVFLRDTCGGSNGPVAGCTPSTIRVSQALNGTQADNLSFTSPVESSISLNARFVAFISLATNLLPTASTPGQVYVLDTCFGAPAGCTAALHKVTVDSNGIELGISQSFALSGDGSFVAFTNLVGVAPNQIQQIFLSHTGF